MAAPGLLHPFAGALVTVTIDGRPPILKTAMSFAVLPDDRDLELGNQCHVGCRDLVDLLVPAEHLLMELLVADIPPLPLGPADVSARMSLQDTHHAVVVCLDQQNIARRNEILLHGDGNAIDDSHRLCNR